ncbi:MAG: hypothetical protein ABIP85_10080 [Chthoniobacteraceae bacterium]
MSAAEILAELPRLSPEEIAAIRRSLGAADTAEIPGTSVRPAGYDSLFGCLADDAAFETPERLRGNPL